MPSPSPSHLPPPTTHLPPINKIPSCSLEHLHDRLRYLRLLYSPEVRGIRRKRRVRVYPPSNPEIEIDATTHNLDLDALRADTSERLHAFRWLTSLCSQASSSSFRSSSESQIDHLLHSASSLLATCAYASQIHRSLSLGSSTHKLNIQLRDAPLENGDYASVGTQTWGGAYVLSELIVDHPEDFGLPASPPSPSRSEPQPPSTPAHLRALELGAGTGLVSLTLTKLLPLPSPSVSVTATDFYPPALTNLAHNISANFPSPPSPCPLEARFLDWSTFPPINSNSDPPPPFDSDRFDLILGADIVYEPHHAQQLKSVVHALLRRPSPSPPSLSPPTLTPTPLPRFHLLHPLRPTHTPESLSLESAFPFSSLLPFPPSLPTHPTLAILTKDLIVCAAHDDGGEEVVYAYYTIGWVGA